MAAAQKLLKRRDVAERLGVTTRTVQNLVVSGKLREKRIPSARGDRSLPRYTETDVAAYIASGYNR